MQRAAHFRFRRFVLHQTVSPREHTRTAPYVTERWTMGSRTSRSDTRGGERTTRPTPRSSSRKGSCLARALDGARHEPCVWRVRSLSVASSQSTASMLFTVHPPSPLTMRTVYSKYCVPAEPTTYKTTEPPGPATCRSTSKASSSRPATATGLRPTYASMAAIISSSSPAAWEAAATAASYSAGAAASRCFCARALRALASFSASSLRFFSSASVRPAACALSKSSACCSGARSAPAGRTRWPDSGASSKPASASSSGAPLHE
mmetsp:Transcript_3366/g.10054  ORF Transcript_3366/g.10054 Transcript_3366/m.10054 type:complete len:263 (-) Transcript_3366:292-1080(-)